MSESPERIGHFPGHQQKFGAGKKTESAKKRENEKDNSQRFFKKYDHQAKLKKQ